MTTALTNLNRPNRGQVEVLEQRRLLAGVVEVVVRGGNLFVTGDEADNAVAISAGAVPGEIEIVGLEETTVIGQTLASGVTGDVRVLMNGGNDIVIVRGVHEEDEEHDEGEEGEEHEGFDLSALPRDLTIDMGDGEDGVRIQFIEIGRNLSVDTRAGNDTVDIGRGPTFGSYEDHDHEEELVLLAEEPPEGEECGEDGGPPPDVVVNNHVSINSGDGNDEVKFAFGRVEGTFSIDTGAGEDKVVTGRGPIRGVHGPGGEDGDCGDEGGDEGGDGEGGNGDEGGDGHAGGRPPDLRIVGDARVLTGADDDFALLRNTRVAGPLTYDGGVGNDVIGVQNLRALGGASVTTQQGDDRIAIYEAIFEGSLWLDTGPGNDILAFVGAEFRGPASVSLGTGQGHDTVVFSGISAADSVSLATGPGNDVAALVNGNTFLGPLLLSGGQGFNRLIDDGSNAYENLVVQLFHEDDDPASLSEVEAALELLRDEFEGFLQGSP